MAKLLWIVPASVALTYLAYKTYKGMMELTAAVEEVAVEEESGSSINDVGDLQSLEDLDVVSNSENGFGSLNETDDAELSEAVNGTPAVDEDSDDEWEFYPKSNPDDDGEYLQAMDIDTDFSEDEIFFNGYSRWEYERYMLIDMSFVRFMPPTIDEEDESEQNRADGLSGFDWAEECDSDSE